MALCLQTVSQSHLSVVVGFIFQGLNTKFLASFLLAGLITFNVHVTLVPLVRQLDSFDDLVLVFVLKAPVTGRRDVVHVLAGILVLVHRGGRSSTPGY